jgi:nucleotide-binding universal stress UspA family protein
MGTMVYFKRILVPTDMSAFSLAAMEYAASLRLLYASTLYILHVGEDPPALLSLHGAGEGNNTGRLLEGYRRDLDKFVADNIPADIKITPVVRIGNPADVIRAFAEEEGVDLIVMATHGRTGLRHIFMGSVAEKVVRLSNIPVLSVKPSPVQDTIIDEKDVENELHLR